jgi:methionine-rich copper-binding protein CopC
MKRRLLMLLSIAPALAWVRPVAAHAALVRAMPAAGSSVHESPAWLKLWFSERLEPAVSSIEVFDGASKRIDSGDLKGDSADSKLLQVSLPRLAPGRYKVAWRVVSVDTHVAKGEYTFDIKP